MATILLTWELGGGIGHLMNLRPIGEELVRRGHRVVAAVRDLSRVRELYAGTGIDFLPAPLLPPAGPGRFAPICGFAHILGNSGFSDERHRATLFAAWNTLFDCVQPDLVVADHSPSVLLALWGRVGRGGMGGRSIRRVNIGLGFFCPPDAAPLPIWTRPEQPSAPREQVLRDEQQITQQVNGFLESQRRPKLARLAQLFNAIDEVFLATYQDFDHFGPREGSAGGGVRYWGHWPFGSGVAPVWPPGQGPKVYAYLKPFPQLAPLLDELRRQNWPTLIFSGGIDPAMQKRYAGPSLRFESCPLDLRQVAAECDVGVLNGTHGTAAALLLAGKPCVLAPLFLEQLIFSRKVEQLGAARLVLKDQKLLAGIVRETVTCRAKAQAFAMRYATWTPGQQLPELVERLHCLAHGPNIQMSAADA